MRIRPKIIALSANPQRGGHVEYGYESGLDALPKPLLDVWSISKTRVSVWEIDVHLLNYTLQLARSLLAIVQKEVGEFGHCFGQHLDTRKVNHAEMIRLMPVEAGSLR